MTSTTARAASPPVAPKTEDDLFNLRLREMNQEMQTLLDKTNQQREDLNRLAAGYNLPGSGTLYTPRPAAFYPAGSVGGGPYFMGGAPLQSAVAELDMRRLCAEEVARWLESNLATVLAPTVERLVHQQLHQLTDSIRGLRDDQEQVKASVEDSTQRWREQQSALKAVVARVERQTTQRLHEFQESYEEQANHWKSELTLMKDTAAEAQTAAQRVVQREERRLDELTRRNQELLHESLSELEGKVLDWKNALGNQLREHTLRGQKERDAVETHVARLEGLVNAVTGAAGRNTADIKTLTEDSVERRSEVRQCRRDVNRLELLVQCSPTVGGERAMAASHAGKATVPTDDGGGGGAHGVSAEHVALLKQELLRVKERLGFFASRMEALERRVYQVDQVVHNLSARPAGGGGGGGEHSGVQGSFMTSQLPASAAPSAVAMGGGNGSGLASQMMDRSGWARSQQRQPQHSMNGGNAHRFPSSATGDLRVPVSTGIPGQLQQQHQHAQPHPTSSASYPNRVSLPPSSQAPPPQSSSAPQHAALQPPQRQSAYDPLPAPDADAKSDGSDRPMEVVVTAPRRASLPQRDEVTVKKEASSPSQAVSSGDGGGSRRLSPGPDHAARSMSSLQQSSPMTPAAAAAVVTRSPLPDFGSEFFGGGYSAREMASERGTSAAVTPRSTAEVGGRAGADGADSDSAGSYVSDSAQPASAHMQGSARGQYAPAPTSNPESEEDNQQLSRLALD